jgi:DNA-binding NarL/FixJ family response regulator
MFPDGAAPHTACMVQSTQDKPLKVFIADDSRLIRDRVAALLAAAQMVVVGEASTPAASIEGILSARPNVVVLDVQLEGGTGLEVLRAVRSAAPEIAVVVFSNSATPAYRKRYLSQGAVGFFDKSTEFDQLALAVAKSRPDATS